MSNPGGAAPSTVRDSAGPIPLPPTRLLLIRHGESTWNAERRIQGQADPPLSEKGRDQARLLATRLKPHPPSVLYTSDLTRTVETAEPLESAWGMVAIRDPGLREIALGEWEGLRPDQLGARYPDRWSAWRRHPDWDLVPGGEGAAAFEARVRAAVDAIVERHPGEDVVCVTHGGVVQSTLAHVVGHATAGLFPFVIGNASLTSFRRLDGRTVVTRVNDTCHLA